MKVLLIGKMDCMNKVNLLLHNLTSELFKLFLTSLKKNFVFVCCKNHLLYLNSNKIIKY